MEIRASFLNNADLPNAAKVLLECVPEAFLNQVMATEYLSKRIDVMDSFCLVYKNGNEILGLSTHDMICAGIISCHPCITQSYRGRGLLKYIFEIASNLSKDLSLSTMCVVDEYNDIVERTLIKVGFAKVGEFKTLEITRRIYIKGCDAQGEADNLAVQDQENKVY